MTDTILCDLSPQAYRRAADFLTALDADWARHVAAVGICRHEAKPAREPYEALVRAVAYQQLHARAADAILARLLRLYPGQVFPTPKQLLNTEPELLRGCGFSAAKRVAIQGIAQATLDNVVPTRKVALGMRDEELVQRLTSLRGVGRWTVEMLLIDTLGRSDILPVGDLGVREGYRRLKRLDRAPTPRQMQEIGQAWSPYRTMATWYLWHPSLRE